jgi:hypothetical protein
LLSFLFLTSPDSRISNGVRMIVCGVLPDISSSSRIEFEEIRYNFFYFL